MNFLATRKTVLENPVLYNEWQRLMKLPEFNDRFAMTNIYLRMIEPSGYYNDIYKKNEELYIIPSHDVDSQEILNIIKRLGWKLFLRSLLKAVKIEMMRLNVYDMGIMEKLEAIPKNVNF